MKKFILVLILALGIIAGSASNVLAANADPGDGGIQPLVTTTANADPGDGGIQP